MQDFILCFHEPQVWFPIPCIQSLFYLNQEAQEMAQLIKYLPGNSKDLRFDAQNPNIIQVGILATGKPGTWEGQTRGPQGTLTRAARVYKLPWQGKTLPQNNWAQSRTPKTNLRSPHTRAYTCICTWAHTCPQIHIHTTYTFANLHTHHIHIYIFTYTPHICSNNNNNGRIATVIAWTQHQSCLSRHTTAAMGSSKSTVFKYLFCKILGTQYI